MGCDLSPDVHSVKASPYSSTTWNNASGRPLAILAGLRDFEPDHIIHEDRLGLCLALDSAVGDEAGKGPVSASLCDPSVGSRSRPGQRLR